VRDLWFRCHYVLVVIHLETRQILHAASTLAPTATWTVQQLRRPHDFRHRPEVPSPRPRREFSATFDAAAKAAGIRVIRTPILAPKVNTFVERCVGSLRRECLDHVLVLSEGHLQRLLNEYRSYFNASRPHQGIGQRCPASFSSPAFASAFIPGTPLAAPPVLGGLHHDYRLAA
jgi:putative transposase